MRVSKMTVTVRTGTRNQRSPWRKVQDHRAGPGTSATDAATSRDLVDDEPDRDCWPWPAGSRLDALSAASDGVDALTPVLAVVR